MENAWDAIGMPLGCHWDAIGMPLGCYQSQRVWWNHVELCGTNVESQNKQPLTSLISDMF